VSHLDHARLEHTRDEELEATSANIGRWWAIRDISYCDRRAGASSVRRQNDDCAARSLSRTPRGRCFRPVDPELEDPAADDFRQAWLRGDRNCGFFKFKHQDELEELWNEYGDRDNLFWQPGMRLPEPI
jgi:hypothetical protein